MMCLQGGSGNGNGNSGGSEQHGDSLSPTVNVFVTGQPGIGKTTLVLNVAKQLPQDVIAGFYTVEAKAEGTGERLGLDVVTFAGERCPLCRLRRGCGPKMGKYYVAIDDFERVVLPHLRPSKKVKLHIIDEIGRMELCSDKFREAVMHLLDSPQAVFGALPAPRYGHTLEQVEQIKQRPDTAVLTLTKANREATSEQVVELLSRLIREAQEQDRAATVATDVDDIVGIDNDDNVAGVVGARAAPAAAATATSAGHRGSTVPAAALSHVPRVSAPAATASAAVGAVLARRAPVAAATNAAAAAGSAATGSLLHQAGSASGGPELANSWGGHAGRWGYEPNRNGAADAAAMTPGARNNANAVAYGGGAPEPVAALDGAMSAAASGRTNGTGAGFYGASGGGFISGMGGSGGSNNGNDGRKESNGMLHVLEKAQAYAANAILGD